MFKAIMLVGMGGFAGSVVRYGVKLVTDKYLPTTFPLATFLINVSGAFIIGLLYGLLQRNQVNDNIWLVAATGFCGGFTTFSTFALENNMLMNDKQTPTAILYTILSLVLGLLFCRLGMYLTR